MNNWFTYGLSALLLALSVFFAVLAAQSVMLWLASQSEALGRDVVIFLALATVTGALREYIAADPAAKDD